MTIMNVDFCQSWGVGNESSVYFTVLKVKIQLKFAYFLLALMSDNSTCSVYCE